jgi:hypothetical protein
METPRQRLLRWDGAWSNVYTIDDLRGYLEDHQVRFIESYHAIYIPPQPMLASKIGDFVDHYPSDAGFKIPKNLAPPERVHYLADADQRWVTRSLMGGVDRQVDAANVLYAFGIGTRLYDVTEVSTRASGLTCFVVEHVEGTQPSPDEHRRFMRELRRLMQGALARSVALATPRQFDDDDFLPPDCNGNLIRRNRDGRLLYVDFQQFLVLDRVSVLRELLRSAKGELHFGETRLFRGSQRYLYQSVPGLETGKRDSDRRWHLISGLLSDNGICLNGRVALDIGCNAGMMLALALSQGAAWGVGWDRAAVATQAERIQSVVGNTRLTFVPTDLDPKYQIAKDLPSWLASTGDGAVLFYLAVWRHMGFIEDVKHLPWKALVFEGHQDDSAAESAENYRTMERLWGCSVVATTTVTDGDSGSRDVALLVRE